MAQSYKERNYGAAIAGRKDPQYFKLGRNNYPGASWYLNIRSPKCCGTKPSGHDAVQYFGRAAAAEQSFL
jgi:hypothetical protein